MKKCIFVGLLVIITFWAFGETKWKTIDEAKRECQGFSDCYNCDGVGFTTKSEIKKVITDKGLKYITEKCYVACPNCLEQKTRIQANKVAKEKDEHSKRVAELKHQLEMVRSELKMIESLGISSVECCDIHKWKDAPLFGGDYQTEVIKALYAANYMRALELESKKLLTCTCSKDGRSERKKALRYQITNIESQLEMMGEFTK